jgi:hypothetical protein
MNRFEQFRDHVLAGRRGDVYDEYMLTDPSSSSLFDKDCADSHKFFTELGLKYEISSRHWCTVTDSDRVEDMVSVHWEFWKEREDE